MTRGKGPHMYEVWWLTVFQFLRYAILIISPEKKENKDSTENKKTVKDSEAIWNLFIRG